jgi:putative NIF3 family GTP cyclohydrolase 1 type 2
MEKRVQRFVIVILLTVAGSPAGAAEGAAHSLPAKEIVARIIDKVGCPQRPADTVDTFKAGDAEAPVTGIVTTMFATADILARAAATGKNLIIAHEPTFYEHTENTRSIAGDPVLAAKQAFIKAHNLIVWRFHDQIHCRRPDGIMEGLVETLGWQKYQRQSGPSTFVLPETSVRALAAQLRDKLKARAVRVVGNLDMKVTRIGLVPGFASGAKAIRILARDDVSVLVAGESREWETVEYVRDAVAQGRPKALILVGHAASEEAGMDAAARWLRTFIPEVPIEFIAAGDPFATP